MLFSKAETVPRHKQRGANACCEVVSYVLKHEIRDINQENLRSTEEPEISEPLEMASLTSAPADNRHSAFS